jgi:hypothetical protein
MNLGPLEIIFVLGILVALAYLVGRLIGWLSRLIRR